MSILKFKFFASFYLVVFLAGCSFGPEYIRPDMELASNFKDPVPTGEAIANLPWWEVFMDENLQNLISLALDNNRDLLIASARIDEQRARLGFTKAGLYPRFDLKGVADRTSPSRKTNSFDPQIRNDFGIFGDLTFEIDLWGRLRRASEAEAAQLLSTEYALRTVTICLLANVSSIYFNIIELNRRLALSNNTLANRREATKLIDQRFQGGIVAELDLNQAQIEEANIEAIVANLERELRRAENALAVLLGTTKPPVVETMSFDTQHLPEEIPAGFPAELLERRPDLLALEQQTKAAYARIGVAIAERLPNLSLNGRIGLQSKDITDLGDGTTWSIGGDLIAPILSFGKARAIVEGREAEAQQALFAYEKGVYIAVQEVEDALIGVRTYRSEHASRTRQLQAATNAARLSRARYDDGVTSYLEVLDIERSLYEAQLAVSATQQGYLNSLVQLYKALGGGWIN